MLQNLFALFGVFALIFQLIKAMLNLSFKIPPCDSDDGSTDGCCTPDVCPSFIKNNDTIISSTGTFLYFNEVGLDSGLTLPPGFPPIVSVIRPESWQFYDANLSQALAFINITNAFDLPAGTRKIFFPNGASYNKNTDPTTVPYTINFTVLYDPAAYSKTDPKGIRNIKINNAIVQSPPIAGVASYNNALIAPTNGTLSLIGGTITEMDGTPILDGNGQPITITDFFHAPINQHGATPLSTDGVKYSNVSYTFNITHEILVGASLITLGCLPEVAADRNFINATIGSQFNSNSDKLLTLLPLIPDMTAAQNCVVDAINSLRNNVSPDSVTNFQASIVSCINDLQNSTEQALSAAILAGFDQYKSTFSLTPTIQFTTQTIQVAVALNDSQGNSLTKNLPQSVASIIAQNLTANITFGDISPFTYDGYQFFDATLSSQEAGNGTIKIAFDNNYISTLTNPSNIDQAPSVAITVESYTFIQSISGQGDGQPRRDETDVAREV